MRSRWFSCIVAVAAALWLFPGAASAQQTAYTAKPVNLRAGPAADYPVVSQLPGGIPVTVMGCISGYSWCDVAVPNLRGWIYAGNLTYPYQGGNVPLITYGPTIGLPLVTFSLGAYWGSYYRGRPWYADRDRWAHRPPPRPGWGHYPGHGRPPPPPHGRPPFHGGPPGHGRPPSHGGPPGHGRPPSHGGPPGHGRPPSHGGSPGHGRPSGHGDSGRGGDRH
jgi:uncharacterized protein YraI